MARRSGSIRIALLAGNVLATWSVLAADVTPERLLNPDKEPQNWLMNHRNAATGKLLWRKYTIPAPGEPGSETWKDKNNSWQTGGGAVWVTGTYDADTNQTLWGVGNPVPMMDARLRPGDNLFTNSVVSWDPDATSRTSRSRTRFRSETPASSNSSRRRPSPRTASSISPIPEAATVPSSSAAKISPPPVMTACELVTNNQDLVKPEQGWYKRTGTGRQRARVIRVGRLLS
jgi:hypothetical protein